MHLSSVLHFYVRSYVPQVQLYNRKINIGDRDLFERGLKHEATDENDQAIMCYIRAGVWLCV